MMGWIYEFRGQERTGQDKTGLCCLPGLAAAPPFPLASDLMVLEVITRVTWGASCMAFIRDGAERMDTASFTPPMAAFQST